MNQLESLKSHTLIVADTGDIDSIAEHRPRDATTNPSLLLKAARKAEYADLIEEARHYGEAIAGDEGARREAFLTELFVVFGRQILDIVPGRVSTEVDANLSFDTAGTIEKARRFIARYEAHGIHRERVLVKIASTWEGVQAARQLETEGIHCNLTLLFSFAQAVACAEAHVTLISPFVGRIYDWYRTARGVDDIPIEEDPGVLSVEQIYNYYKNQDYATEVMGASFRKASQVVALSGCDLLTISPELLQELADDPNEAPCRLSTSHAQTLELERIHLDEAAFRWLHNQDPMGVEKLADGIRRFDADARKLAEEVATTVPR